MITLEFCGHAFVFETHPSLFSPSAVDAGTLALLSRADLSPPARLLDLGCGYGAVGIVAAWFLGGRNVVMLDNDDTAVFYAGRNAALNDAADVTILKSDAFSALDASGFDLILCNPPYHTDFSVPKTFIEKGFNRLSVGGRMLLVTKRRTWYEKKLAAVFGGVRGFETDGYFVFEAEKRRKAYAGIKRQA